MSRVLTIIQMLIILIFSIILHEVAHGYVALLRGDPTARDAGRLTFNPLPHIDIFGSIILPIMGLLLSGWVIGWAKPVPINPYNFREPQKDMMLVGTAGPASNVGLAIVGAILFRVGLGETFVGQFLAFLIFINLLLLVFNLVPIPPLDGSRILQHFLPIGAREAYMRIEPFGFFILLFLLWAGLFHRVLLPIVRALFSVLTGQPI
jgi:Zn-dependent protease